MAFVEQLQAQPTGWQFERARLLRQLQADGRRHLVMVRYKAQDTLANERVYNGADIDGAPVVWAREMDPDQDRQLLAYFPHRQVWLLEVGNDSPPRLIPYPRVVTRPREDRG